MRFIAGGYFLVQPRPSTEWRQQKPLLPEKFWTVDGDLCHLYPDLWGWSWTGISGEETADVKARLGQGEAAYRVMQRFVETLFEAGDIGFGGVFFDPESARGFHHRFTSRVPDIKLLSVALAADQIEVFLAHQPPDREKNEGEPGIRAMVRKSLAVASAAGERGYEVLGYDHGAFNSFAVNYLENEYVHRLGLCLKGYGLFDDYALALQAAERTAKPTTGSEPGLWLPWKVSEHNLR